MPNVFTAAVLLGSLCLLSLPGQAMSRLYDGEAEVWVAQETLCFGGRAFKSPGLFFNRTLGVDRHQVEIHAVEVNGTGASVYWRTGSDDLDDALALTTSTCIAYGEHPAGWHTRHAAIPLAEGLYSVMLNGSDRKSGNRARFYKQFCVWRSGNHLAVTGAYYDERLQRWNCSR